MTAPTDEPKTLRLRRVPHLATQLGIAADRLLSVADDAPAQYIEFDKVVKGKLRHLIMARPFLATVQRRILDNVLCRLPISEHAYGAIKGRSIRKNAAVHAAAPFVAKLDIRDFYPSIRFQRVYDFFIGQECSPDVARVLTQLTTYRHALPLGVATSPFLADQIVSVLDDRIGGIARKYRLHYTRYVDDITISGNFDLAGIAKVIMGIIRQAGFRVKQSKLELYRPGDGKERIITGARVEGGKVLAPMKYTAALKSELIAAWQESLRASPSRDFETKQQYRGKIGFVMWLDPVAGKELFRLYRKVKWRHLEWALRRLPRATSAVGVPAARPAVAIGTPAPQAPPGS